MSFTKLRNQGVYEIANPKSLSAEANFVGFQ